jgi:peptidoglycan hydrolase-like protein with peptidoglycan-binding domain
MTPTLLPRTAWTMDDPARDLTPMDPNTVDGTCFHWPGTTSAIGDAGRERTAVRLEGYRRYHTSVPPVGRGWSDVAYQLAVDQGGRAWSLRGIKHRSAANGTRALNDRLVAVLLLVGPREQPSPAMLDTARWLRSEVILKAYPGAVRVVGHGQVRPDGTECPGAVVQGRITAGEFTLPWLSPATPAVEWVFTLRRYLMVGVDGEDVRLWQRRCNDLVSGTWDTRVDGDFGPDTARLTRLVQGQFGVLADGIVGPVTAKRARVRWAGP